jgi:apolipoprotein N-acyltransferase
MSKKEIICTLASGLLYPLAFAPFDCGWLAPFALALLFFSWHMATPIQAFKQGYVFGLLSFGVGLSWVYVSMHQFGGVPKLSAGIMTAVFVAFWSLFPAVCGYLAAWIWKPAVRLSALPALWLLVDYLRGAVVLNGFPWLLPAYSQLAMPLAGYMPVLGVYGTGFLLLVSAAVLTRFIGSDSRWRPGAALMLIIWTAGGFLQKIQWTHRSGDALPVALIQGNIAQDKKWRPEYRSDTLKLYKTLTEAHWQARLIIWPETAVPAYLDEVGENFLFPLSRIAQAHNSDLIVSVPMRNTLKTERYNAVITLGKTLQIYQKNHLLPFGEYLPWQPLSGWILSRLKLRLGDFTPGGARQPLMKAGGFAFAASICYEDAFGAEILEKLPDAAFLVNVTNDGWFGNTIEPYQHLQIARMRALETGRYLVRATNTGATAIIDPRGRIIAQAPLFATTVLTGQVEPMTGMTPYAYIGDKPIVFLAGSWLALSLPAIRRLIGSYSAGRKSILAKKAIPPIRGF